MHIWSTENYATSTKQGEVRSILSQTAISLYLAEVKLSEGDLIQLGLFLLDVEFYSTTWSLSSTQWINLVSGFVCSVYSSSLSHQRLHLNYFSKPHLSPLSPRCPCRSLPLRTTYFRTATGFTMLQSPLYFWQACGKGLDPGSWKELIILFAWNNNGSDSSDVEQQGWVAELGLEKMYLFFVNYWILFGTEGEGHNLLAVTGSF